MHPPVGPAYPQEHGGLAGPPFDSRGPTALYLQQPERYFRMVDLAQGDSLYVQFRSNFDMAEEKIAPFVTAVEQRLASAPPRNLILDLRFDTGGDNTQNRGLMREIARRVPGRIFLLTGPYTFSAGIASAAALIHDGGGKVVVIGDEPGDRTHWWSEHEPLCLPYSKACVDREIGHWNLIDGCAGEAHCFGDQFDVRITTLAPAVRRPLTPQDWLAGRDTAMEVVEALLGRRGDGSNSHVSSIGFAPPGSRPRSRSLGLGSASLG